MKQKTWFITGAGSGFGYILTKQLLASGHKVAATTRRHFEKLNLLKQCYDQQLWLAQLDVTDHKAVEQITQAAFEHFGTIDVLFSNAGYVLLGALEEITLEQIHRQINTNLLGAIYLIKSFLPYLRQQKQGHIIQMSSEAGQIAYPALSIYHASKWGIEGFCESLAREVSAFNIKVSIIEPGRTETGFDANAEMPEQFLEDYQKSTVGNYRRLLAMNKLPNIGDPQKIIKEIIKLTEIATPPLRLTLGSDAYRNISKALQLRIKELENQKETALSTDSLK